MQSPIEETYEEVQKLMFFICHKFARKHGGMIDDLMSTANLTYMKAYKQWKPGSASFSTYLSNCIYRRLLGEWRFNRRRRKSLKLKSMGEYQPQQPEEIESTIPEVIEQLGEDARNVMQLIQETPTDLAVAIEGKGGAPRNYRTCIREYLKKKGWTTDRVNSSFIEITGVLEAV